MVDKIRLGEVKGTRRKKVLRKKLQYAGGSSKKPRRPNPIITRPRMHFRQNRIKVNIDGRDMHMNNNISKVKTRRQT